MTKKEKVVFVNPPMLKGDMWGRLKGGASTLPPLGIALLAGVVRDRGFSVSLFDFLATDTDIEEAAGEILDLRPRWVGITATTEMINSAAALARSVKIKNPDIKILIGGPHVSSVPRQTMETFPEFDVAFIGEGDRSLPEYLASSIKGADIGGVKGIMFRSGGQLRHTGAFEYIENMDELSFPAWDLLPDIKRYYQPAVTNYKRLPYASLVTSRGCPGQCIFCDKSVFGNRIRGYSAEYIFKMIRTLMENYGVREVCFYDDNFILLKDRLKKFCMMLKDEKADLIWSCSARVDTVDAETLKMIRDAGCWQIGYGIESGSDSILKLIKKNTDVEKIRQAVNASRQAGLLVRGYFIIGNPGETRQTLKETLRLMSELPLNDLLVEYMTPYPGSELYNNIEKYGHGTKRWERLNTFSINFIPKDVTRKDMEDSFVSSYRNFYLRPATVISYIKRFKNPVKLFKIFLLFLQFLMKKG